MAVKHLSNSQPTPKPYIRSQAAKNVLLLDTYTLLADESGRLQPQYASDELHLNSAGYERLNQELIKLTADLTD